jgi:hypothetical protein
MKTLARCLLVTGFALLIFGGKLWLLDVAGSDLPVWDQWDAEDEYLIRPWLEHRLDWSILNHAHNEHHLVTSKLFALGLFVINGQWDALVEATANALVHTASALLLLALARRWLHGGWLVLCGALLVLLFTLPFSWENTLFGFQGQFYFLTLLSLGHVWLSLDDTGFAPRWFLGQVLGLFAVVTMASGCLSSAAVLTVLFIRLVRERRLAPPATLAGGLALGFSPDRLVAPGRRAPACAAPRARRGAIPNRPVAIAHLAGLAIGRRRDRCRCATPGFSRTVFFAPLVATRPGAARLHCLGPAAVRRPRLCPRRIRGAVLPIF